MIHVEDVEHWNGGELAGRLGLLAKTVGPDGGRGAKISLQCDLDFLNQNSGSPNPYMGDPNGVGSLIAYGGNLWCHTHESGGAHLSSVHACVASVYAATTGVLIASATEFTAGRSGGPESHNKTADWVSISVGKGIRRMNSTATNYFSTMEETLRPYGMSNEDIDAGGLYFHDAAPGPIDETVPTTMRQRPFWVQTSSMWDARLECVYPVTDPSSILMIPHPGRFPLGIVSGGVEVEDSDFRGAMTEIWSTKEVMDTHLQSILNVWYIQIRPGWIMDGDLDRFGEWIDSINAMLFDGSESHGEWVNMNEISSLYHHPTSRYY